MKHLLIILALTSGLGLQAQTKGIKLYAFRQEVSPGIRPATLNEKGETVSDKKPSTANSLIYLEVPEGSAITITELWINGKKHSFDTAREKTPVVLNTGIQMPGQRGMILIPETADPIIRILPGKEMDITSKNTRRNAGKNQVVVYFRKNGRQCRKSIDKMQEVEKMVMQ